MHMPNAQWSFNPLMACLVIREFAALRTADRRANNMIISISGTLLNIHDESYYNVAYMKIFLCRHGQTTGDIEDRFGGDYDDSLTDNGRKQAKELAEKLSGKGIEAIFTSPLKRAMQTSAILKDNLDIRVQVIPELKEQNRYGIITGMNKGEAMKLYPEQADLLSDPKSMITGSEEYDIFKERVLKGLEHITRLDFGTIAIVTHGGPIRLVFREILEKGEIENIPDCSFFVLDVTEGRYSLID